MKIFDKKLNIVLRLVMIMLVLTLLSTYALTGTYAKYTTSASSSPDAARVAKFKVTFDAVLPDQSIMINESSRTETHTFTVKNNSEVAIEYNVILKFETKPTGITIQFKDKNSTWKNGTWSGNTLTFSGNTLPAGTTSVEHQIRFEMPSSYSGEIATGIDFSVVAKQLN